MAGMLGIVLRGVALAAGIGLAALPAAAGTISGGSQGFSLSLDSAGAGLRSSTLTFNAFDPNLGTLTGVSIALSNVQVLVAATASLQDALLALVTAQVGAQFLVRSGAQAVMGGGATISATCSVMTDQIGPCSAQEFSATPMGGSFAPASLLAAQWGPFVGPGTVDLVAEIADLGFFSTPVIIVLGTDTSSGQAFWAGVAEVTYSYDAPAQDTPEPGSLALLATALGLAALRRRG